MYVQVILPGVMRLGVILGAASLPFTAEAPVLAHRITAGVPRASSAQRASHSLTITLRQSLFNVLDAFTYFVLCIVQYYKVYFNGK